MKRWRHEDGLVKTDGAYDSNDSFLIISRPNFGRADPWYISELDFSQIRLTRERLRRIPFQSFPDVDAVALGEVDSVATAMELIGRCGQLHYLDARYVPLTKRDIGRISFAPEWSLYLRQGSLTVQDFCDLNRTRKPSGLAIFASTFTVEEAEQIQDASPGTELEVYTGFREYEDTEMIYPEMLQTTPE